MACNQQVRKLTIGVFVVVFLASQLFNAAHAERMPPIEFDSVQDAFDTLSSNPLAKTWKADGWAMIVIEGDPLRTMWTFSPPGHAAHPTVIKRAPVWLDGDLYVDMRIMCGGAKTACDELVRQFTSLNEEMAAEFREFMKPPTD